MCYRTGEGNHDCSLVLISSVEATANCYWRCTVHQCTVVQVLENAFNTSVANSSVWNAIVANCEGALVSTSHFDTREHDPSLHRLAALLLLGDVVHFNCNAHCVTVVHCAVIVYSNMVYCVRDRLIEPGGGMWDQSRPSFHSKPLWSSCFGWSSKLSLGSWWSRQCLCSLC